MITRQAKQPPKPKPLVTDTLLGQCETRRVPNGITNSRCPRQGSLREITGGIAVGRVKLCDFCAETWRKRDFTVRLVTPIEVSSGASEPDDHYSRNAFENDRGGQIDRGSDK